MEGEQGDLRVHKSIIRQRKEVLWMIHPSEKAEQAVAKFQFIDSIDLFAGKAIAPDHPAQQQDNQIDRLGASC